MGGILIRYGQPAKNACAAKREISQVPTYLGTYPAATGVLAVHQMMG